MNLEILRGGPTAVQRPVTTARRRSIGYPGDHDAANRYSELLARMCAAAGGTSGSAPLEKFLTSISGKVSTGGSPCVVDTGLPADRCRAIRRLSARFDGRHRHRMPDPSASDRSGTPCPGHSPGGPRSVVPAARVPRNRPDRLTAGPRARQRQGSRQPGSRRTGGRAAWQPPVCPVRSPAGCRA